MKAIWAKTDPIAQMAFPLHASDSEISDKFETGRGKHVSGSFQAEIEKPGTQNPGPGQVFKLRFIPS